MLFETVSVILCGFCGAKFGNTLLIQLEKSCGENGKLSLSSVITEVLGPKTLEGGGRSNNIFVLFLKS